MSKSLTTLRNVFLWALLLIPMMFMMTACGDALDTKATCDTGGKYSESDMAALEEVATEEATQFTNGYRLTMTLNMDMGTAFSSLGTETSTASADKMKMDLSINAIVTKDAIVIKATGKAMGKDQEMYMYITDGKMYSYDKTQKENNKVYIEVSGGADMSQVLAELDMTDLMDKINPAAVLAELKEATGAVITANGNHFKAEYSVTEDGMTATTVAYLNFDKNGKFEALRVDADATMMKTSIIMSAYDGEVSLPDFKDYKPATSLEK